jgi:SEC-C motif-containing protein
MSKCPCGTGLELATCCDPYLKGKAKPATAEKLMRARYTAFTTADVDYIEQTTDQSQKKSFDRAGTLEWAKNSEWKGLEVVSVKDGLEKDTTAEVEFIARYAYNDSDQEHHERADFKKRGDQWFFVDGRLVQAPARNENKIGRNDACTCGSGKKYKKCCGAAA